MAALNKPTEFPRWGTDQSNEVDPSSGQKDTGWTFEQIPPSAFQNFLSRVTYDWINWLAERLDDDIDGGGLTEDGVAFTDPVTREPTGSRGVTKIRLLNPIGGSVRVSAIAITNNIGGSNAIEATGALFVSLGVLLNDLVELAGTNSNDGFYIVNSIVGEDDITVNRLNGGGGAFASEASIQGTVKVYAKGAVRGELIAPGGWKLSEKVSGEGVILKKNPGVGATIDWIFPDDLPATKSVLTFDENGQLIAETPVTVTITIGDGTNSFGDFEGTDETPFNDALAALPASGGRIEPGEGTYTFTTTLDITDDDVQLVGVGRERVLITGALASAAIIKITGSNVLIEDIHVQQTQGDSENFVFQVVGDDARIIRCRAEHTFVAATPTFGFKVVQILNADNVWFEGNEVLFAEVDSDVDRIGVHVFCESTGADEEMFHTRILRNDFIITNDGSASLDQNSVIRLHAKASATGHAKLYKWVVEGNIERTPIGVENTLHSIALYAENDAGGAAGDIGRVRGGIVRGNITNRGITLVHDRQNGSAEDPVVEDNVIQGNMVTTSVVGDPVVEIALNGATIPVDDRNSGLLASRFVAATSGGSPTTKVDDSDYQQKGNLQSS